MIWIHRLRLRVLAWALGIALAGIAFVSWMALPVWPVVGVAVAVVVATVTSMTSRLSAATCLSCGKNLEDIVAGEHGLACPACGSITRTLAQGASPDSELGDSETDSGEADREQA